MEEGGDTGGQRTESGGGVGLLMMHSWMEEAEPGVQINASTPPPPPPPPQQTWPRPLFVVYI
ncbi:hypothetical protein INR49_020383 [Caranx melampygus]|nr:hypothetical protein INR49_020383 [Caranx melampygus]